jgi:hypothetical protein
VAFCGKGGATERRRKIPVHTVNGDFERSAVCSDVAEKEGFAPPSTFVLGYHAGVCAFICHWQRHKPVQILHLLTPNAKAPVNPELLRWRRRLVIRNTYKRFAYISYPEKQAVAVHVCFADLPAVG